MQQPKAKASRPDSAQLPRRRGIGRCLALAMPGRSWVPIAILAGTLAACAHPGLRADSVAANAGLERIEVTGQTFRHIAYVGATHGAQGPVWVFIEGDGIPWIAEIVPAADP